MDYISEMNLGLVPILGELKNAISFVESEVEDQELWNFYYEELEYNEYYVDFVTNVQTYIPSTIRLEVPTDITLQLGHLPIVMNSSGELYVKMPLLEDI